MTTIFASCLLAALQLHTPTTSCTVETRGARISSWKVGGEERLWNPSQPRDAQGRWEHGGIPLAWPWFGRTGPGGARTIHGFAWRQEFAVVRQTANEVVLSTYSENFTLEYTITLTDKLRLALRTTNVSDKPAKVNFGYHPYFLLAERDRACVKGLESVDLDMPLTRAPDDVFPCAKPGAVVELRDGVKGCAIHVESPDCGEIVVWNPGSEWPKGGYPEIDDFGSSEDWRHFAAVEPRVGSWKKIPELAPGESRTLVAEFSVRQFAAPEKTVPAAAVSVASPHDRVVYRPRQSVNRLEVDPTKRGDRYNDHFQVIWDPKRQMHYAFWTQATNEGNLDMHVMFTTSTDRGHTWSEPVVLAGGEKIAEPKPRATWQQPMLAKSGRLYVLWNQQVNEEKLHHGIMMGMYSDDGGATWSKPERNDSIPLQYRDDPTGKSLPNWCNWQRPLRLAKDGKFLVGCTRNGTGRGEKHRVVAIEFWRFENIDENPEIKDLKITVLSGGKNALTVPAGNTDRFIAEEAGVVKLPDGRLFALMRTRNRHPYWSQSRDAGETWSKPQPLCDAQGKPYLHPCSPCPIYDYAGCEAASGNYFAMIHNAYDDKIEPLGRQIRGPVYMIRGKFDPTAAQPIVFGAPELFSAVKKDNSYYASYTHDGTEGVFWYAHQKNVLLGKRMTE